MRKTLLVLAAGLGSRYSENLKQLEAVDDVGHMLIHYTIWEAVKAGFTKIIFVIRKGIRESFIERLGTDCLNFLHDAGVLVDFAFQSANKLPDWYSKPLLRQKPYGTVHAILCAEPHLKDEPFFVVNADDFYDTECLAKASAMMAAQPDSVGLVAYWLHRTLPPEGEVNRGVCAVKSPINYGLTEPYKLLDGITETRGLSRGTDEKGMNGAIAGPVFYSSSTLVSMNTWVFPPTILPVMDFAFSNFIMNMPNELTSEYVISDFISEYLKGFAGKSQRKINVSTCSCDWFGLTKREDLDWVKQELKDFDLKIPKQLPF